MLADNIFKSYYTNEKKFSDEFIIRKVNKNRICGSSCSSHRYASNFLNAANLKFRWYFWRQIWKKVWVVYSAPKVLRLNRLQNFARLNVNWWLDLGNKCRNLHYKTIQTVFECICMSCACMWYNFARQKSIYTLELSFHRPRAYGGRSTIESWAHVGLRVNPTILYDACPFLFDQMKHRIIAKIFPSQEIDFHFSHLTNVLENLITLGLKSYS